MALPAFKKIDDVLLLMTVGDDLPAFRIPRPSKKDVVEGINKKSELDYN
jgi:hypothetical protein